MDMGAVWVCGRSAFPVAAPHVWFLVYWLQYVFSGLLSVCAPFPAAALRHAEMGVMHVGLPLVYTFVEASCCDSDV
jgi:hypothetical protein